VPGRRQAELPVLVPAIQSPVIRIRDRIEMVVQAVVDNKVAGKVEAAKEDRVEVRVVTTPVTSDNDAVTEQSSMEFYFIVDDNS